MLLFWPIKVNFRTFGRAEINMPKASAFDWSDLFYFLAVARAGRLTVAARRLGVEHSTVSRRIAALERALGAQLFNRLQTGYTLTPSGERLLASAEEMEAVAGTIVSDIGGADIAISGSVRIGAPDGFGSCFLAPCVGSLLQRHRALELELIAMPRIFNLSRREADIAIGLSRPEEGRLHALKLTDYELGVYAARSYLAHAAPVRTRADLAQHRFIGYVDDYIFSPELDYVPLLLSDVRPAVRSVSVVAQLNATLAAAGLCILPRFMAEPHAALQRLLPDEVRLIRTYWLIAHADVFRLARVRAVADFVLAAVKAAQPLFLQAG